MYSKAMISLAIIGVFLSLSLGFFSVVSWEIVGVFIAVSLGIPTLIAQVKVKPKEKEQEQEIKLEEKIILRDETIRVRPHCYHFYELGFTRGENLKGTVSSSNHIDIYFLNVTNFKKWEKDIKYHSEYCTESVFETNIDYVVPRTGTWYMLIENNGRKTAKVKVLLYISN